MKNSVPDVAANAGSLSSDQAGREMSGNTSNKVCPSHENLATVRDLSRIGAIVGVGLICLAVQACGGSSGGGGSPNDGDADPGLTGGNASPGTDSTGDPVPDDSSDPDPDTSDEVPDRGLADVEGSAFYAGISNAALLNGSVLGEGTVDNETLRGRPIPFDDDTFQEDRLKLVSMTVLPTQPRATLIGVVENETGEFFCDIKLDSIDLIDQNGNEIDVGGTFIGAMEVLGGGGIRGATVGGPVFSDQCMGSGSKAYVITSVNVDASEIASFESILFTFKPTFATETFVPYDGSVAPVSYFVNDEGDMEITIVNGGSTSTDLDAVQLLYLDEEGFPIGSLSEFMSETLESGEQAQIVLPTGSSDFDRFDFAGSSSSVRVWLELDPGDIDKRSGTGS